MMILMAMLAGTINVQAVLGFPVLSIEPVHLDDQAQTTELLVFGADRWYRTVVVYEGAQSMICLSHPFHPDQAGLMRAEVPVREVNQRSAFWRFSVDTQVLDVQPITLPLAWAQCVRK